MTTHTPTPADRVAYTERRKADRAAMAAIITEQATTAGAVVERLEPAPLSPRGVWLHIQAPGGLRVTVDLDGDSCQPDVHVLAWNLSLDSGRKMSPAFWYAVNRFHFGKCTEVREGFEPMLARVVEGVRAAVDGRAYQ